MSYVSLQMGVILNVSFSINLELMNIHNLSLIPLAYVLPAPETRTKTRAEAKTEAKKIIEEGEQWFQAL